MSVDYWRCGMCGVQLMTDDETNIGKLPAMRRFKNEAEEKELIAVRYAQCATMPYRLEEEQPSRIDLIGREDTTVIHSCNSTFNCWPMGIGPLLEVHITTPDDELMAAWRSNSIEIGFLVEEDVNLIVVAYRRGDRKFNVTPYSWLAYSKWTRYTPPLDPQSDEDRKFTVAYEDTCGGIYRVIREMKMPVEFAKLFHKAIHDQIARGIPDREKYRWRVQNLGSLLYENKVESLLAARCVLE